MIMSNDIMHMTPHATTLVGEISGHYERLNYYFLARAPPGLPLHGLSNIMINYDLKSTKSGVPFHVFLTI